MTSAPCPDATVTDPTMSFRRGVARPGREQPVAVSGIGIPIVLRPYNPSQRPRVCRAVTSEWKVPTDFVISSIFLILKIKVRYQRIWLSYTCPYPEVLRKIYKFKRVTFRLHLIICSDITFYNTASRIMICVSSYCSLVSKDGLRVWALGPGVCTRPLNTWPEPGLPSERDPKTRWARSHDLFPSDLSKASRGRWDDVLHMQPWSWVDESQAGLLLSRAMYSYILLCSFNLIHINHTIDLSHFSGNVSRGYISSCSTIIIKNYQNCWLFWV